MTLLEGFAIRATCGPPVPPCVAIRYQTTAEEGGPAPLFVQQYVKRGGRRAISHAEIARGLAPLREWKAGGARPPAGALP
jgi:hypothetical protein